MESLPIRSAFEISVMRAFHNFDRNLILMNAEIERMHRVMERMKESIELLKHAVDKKEEFQPACGATQIDLPVAVPITAKSKECAYQDRKQICYTIPERANTVRASITQAVPDSSASQPVSSDSAEPSRALETGPMTISLQDRDRGGMYDRQGTAKDSGKAKHTHPKHKEMGRVAQRCEAIRQLHASTLVHAAQKTGSHPIAATPEDAQPAADQNVQVHFAEVQPADTRAE